MWTAALLTAVFGSVPSPPAAFDGTGTVMPPTFEGQVCLPIPAEPTLEVVHPFADTGVDGLRLWGATATYGLSSGDTGEALLVIDSEGTGEAQIMINGAIVAHAAITTDPATGQAIVTTWYPADIPHEPSVIAEMLRVDVTTIVADQIPQEFKCSPWGQKVTKAASVLFRATAYAAGGACCAATAPSIVGCAICAAGSGLAADAIGDSLGKHCD